MKTNQDSAVESLKEEKEIILWNYLNKKLDSKTAKEVWNRVINIFKR